MATVERIKWTSNRIIAVSRSSNTTFDTNNRYLRTDPQGVFKIGGYQPTPGIWGRDATIQNHDDMWYPSRIIGTWSEWWAIGSTTNISNTWLFGSDITEATFGRIDVPKCSVAKIIVFPDQASPTMGTTYGGIEFTGNVYYGPLQYVQLNGKDTSTQFRWIARTKVGTNIDYSTGQGINRVVAYVAPYLYNASYLPVNKNASGYYRFPAPPGYIDYSGNGWQILSVWAQKLVNGATGATLISDFSAYQESVVNIHPWCIMTKLDPVTLSVGLTA